jgi:ABC-2 type transport system permease protein
VFRVTAIIMLLAVALAVVLPAVLSGKNSAQRVGVVGTVTPTINSIVVESGRLGGGAAVAVAEPSVAAAEASLRSGDLNAVLVPDQEIIVQKVPIGGVSGSTATLAQLAGISRLIQAVPGAAAEVEKGVSLPVRGLAEASEPLSDRLTGLFTIIAVFILITVYGQQIAMGIGEEKSSRVVEVLLSTLRPVQLLVGKVLGLGLLALAQAAGMVVVFIVAGFASGSNLVHGASLGVAIVGGVFMVLGYAFYCTAYAAVGSLVSRPSDVNSTILPIQIPLILAYALNFTVIYADSASTFYHVLGFLPPTAPIAMIAMYAAGDVPLWQVLIAMALMVAGTVWMARLAAKIYSNSILRTGPSISIRQALREVRSA